MRKLEIDIIEFIRSVIIVLTITYLVFFKDISAWLYLLLIVTSVKYTN